MRFAALLGLAATLGARAAHADQCQWLADRELATRAMRELAHHAEVVTFCEPCGDQAPGAPRIAARVTLRPDGNAISVAIDGDPVDLAYTYVKTGEHQYRNLAQLAGCPTSSVSPRLRVDAATPTGVLIRADPAPAAAPVPVPVPVSASVSPAVTIEPPPPPVAPTIYIETPSPAGPALLLLGCGALVGFLAAAKWLAIRRRATHQPRATRLEPPG